MASRLLITGFDPFGSLKVNPSSELAQWLGETLPEADAVELPTSYGRSVAALDDALTDGKYAAILMLGYADGPSGVRLERVASNRTTAASPDNDGVKLQGPIDSAEPSNLATSFDCDYLAHEIERAGGKARLSDNAGGFVCNYGYFHVLRSGDGRFPPALFAHVANADELTRLSVYTLARAISTTLG